MKGSIRITKIGACTISIHWSFLLLLAWIVLVNFFQGFEGNQVVRSLLLLLAGTGSLILHEIAHLGIANIFGIRPREVVFLPVGDLTTYDSKAPRPGVQILIALAGPMINLAIAGALALFIHPYRIFFLEPENMGAPGAENFLFQLHILNLILAGINLIPAFPLDGGRILQLLVGYRTNPVRTARLLSIAGECIASLLIISGFVFSNFLLTLAGIFIFLMDGQKQIQRKARGFLT